MSKVEATKPRGFVDYGHAESVAAERLIAKIRDIYRLYGFEGLETPFLEYTQALGKFLPDLDRPNAGVFSLKDDDEQWLSLRYDLTAPLARYVVEHYETLPKPYRSYRAGWVFRNEKPGPGRFRQFMQVDADTVGTASPAADAEMCMMAAGCLEALGIARNDYVIKISHRKILDGLMDILGYGGADKAAQRLIILRAVDKLDRLGETGVCALLGEGRKDESGDFTHGAHLSAPAIERVMALIRSHTSSHAETLANLQRAVAGSHVGEAAVRELGEIVALTVAGGYHEDRIVLDPAVVRGLEYYTGPVFEAELTLMCKDGQRFGSIGGGGRYDGLIARFRSEPVPATGFSIGVSRLIAALRAINSPLVTQERSAGPVVVLAMEPERMADYQRFAQALRNAAIPAEVYLGEGKMNAQLKYADKRGALCAVIQGSNERDVKQILVRDLALGAELAKANKDRADYLEMRSRAQILVPEAELVASVRQVLARGGAPMLT